MAHDSHGHDDHAGHGHGGVEQKTEKRNLTIMIIVVLCIVAASLFFIMLRYAGDTTPIGATPRTEQVEPAQAPYQTVVVPAALSIGEVKSFVIPAKGSVKFDQLVEGEWYAYQSNYSQTKAFAPLTCVDDAGREAPWSGTRFSTVLPRPGTTSMHYFNHSDYDVIIQIERKRGTDDPYATHFSNR